MTAPDPKRRRHRAALLLVALTSACAPRYTDTRGLHYLGDTLVQSQPADPRAYEAYLRARLAMERAPRDLAGAHALILQALHFDRHDPQLWTTKGEIELQMGRLEDARKSSRVALMLRPGFTPAQALLARLQEPGAPQTARAAATNGEP
ncbi:MAG: hypothetical protein R3A51_02850 [Nannocystaceae bacterium]